MTDRPILTQGGNVFLKANKQESVYIEVPESWAGGWTIYTSPSDNYFSLAKGRVLAGIKTRITVGGGKGISQHNSSPRQFLPDASDYYENSAVNSDLWLDCSVMGEAFIVSGNKVTVDIRNVSTVGSPEYNFDVMVSKGLAQRREKTGQSLSLSSLGRVGISIPRFAKKVKLVMTGPGEDVSVIPTVEFVNSNNAAVLTIQAAEWKLFAQGITSDSLGGVVAVSKDTRYIDLPPYAVGIRFNIAATAPSLHPVWEIFE